MRILHRTQSGYDLLVSFVTMIVEKSREKQVTGNNFH